MRILFAGTPRVAATILKELAQVHEIALVLTRPDAQVGRKKIVTPSDVAVAATALGIPVLKSNRIGQDELREISEANVDKAVVVAFGSIIPKFALDLFPWWNLHFSVLPAWRGATPLQHSLIHKTGQGLSLFQIEAALDTGPLLETVQLSHPTDQSSNQIMEDLARMGSQVILRNLAHPPTPKPQTGEVSYAPKIVRENARLDFTESAQDLQRKVFALNPEPMAWCRAGDKDIRVLRAKAIGAVDWNAISERKLAPGEIEFQGGKVLVGCGEGSRLELIEVQPAGGKPMLAVDWQRGYGGSRLE
jgi:methionyl-tRNA formyltransferase